jgi:DNA polymerase I-like protein with 3'-5' exonuclease and polymerase domains
MPTFIAIDIETTGLYPVPSSKIYCIAVNTDNSIQVYEDSRKIKAILEDKSITKVIHNAAFDCFWLKMIWGITVTNIWDTMLMEQVIIGDNISQDDGKVSEELKEKLSASLIYTLKRYGLAELKDKHIGAAFATRNRLSPLTQAEIEYSKNDVRYLLHLQAMQERRLAKLDLIRVANLENKVVERVIDMRVQGIGIDKGKWLQIEAQNIANRQHILKRLPASVANWNSPAQVKKYFNSVGVAMQSFEDITYDFIEHYNNDVLTKFVEMRRFSTSISKYGSKFLFNKEDGRNVIDADGRIRANFKQILNTGRFSCYEPPLHGLPREGEQRSAFVPHKGYVFVKGDFGGQETGIMAAASKEELWIKALLRGEDPLSLMASMLFSNWSAVTEKGCVFPKKCKCTIHKKLRQDSKEITYGIAYGAYPLSISKKIKCTKKETALLFKKHHRAAPKLNRWLEKNAKETIKTRMSYSADLYRRRRTVRDPEEWQVRNVGFNNPVQSCAANMIKLSMISLSPSLPIVLTWHDELILEVKKAAAKKAAKELKIIMEKAADYCTGIPGLIKVEPSIVMNLMK